MSHHNLHRQEAVVEYPEYHDESPVDQIGATFVPGAPRTHRSFSQATGLPHAESPPASPPRSPPRSTLNIHAPRDPPNFRHDRHEAPLPPLPVSHHLYEGRPHSPHRLSTNRQTTNLGLSIPSSFTQHHHVQQVGEVSPLSQHSDDHALHNSNEQAWHQIEWEHQTGHDVDHEYAQIVSSHLSQERRAAIGRMVGAELEHRRRMAEMRPGSAGGVHRPRRRDAIWDRFRGRPAQLILTAPHATSSAAYAAPEHRASFGTRKYAQRE
ncbi:hypothetical protein JCM11251_007631 [Rhodosporidiobolus azoricus]